MRGQDLHGCGGPVVLAASTHLAACLPHVPIQETTRAYYADWYPTVVTGLPRLDRGQVYVGEAPGHGLTVHAAMTGGAGVHRRRTENPRAAP